MASGSSGKDTVKQRYIDFAERVSDRAKIEAIKQAAVRDAAFLHTDVVYGFLGRNQAEISKLFEDYGNYQVGSGRWEEVNRRLYKLGTGKDASGRSMEARDFVRAIQSGLVGLASDDIDGKAGPQTLNAIAATAGLGGGKVASFTKGDRIVGTPEIAQAQRVTFKPSAPQVGETVHLAVTGKGGSGTLKVRGPDGTVFPLEDGNFKPDKEGTYQVYQEAGTGALPTLLAVLMVLQSGVERVRGMIEGRAPGKVLLNRAATERPGSGTTAPAANGSQPVENSTEPLEKAPGPFDAEITTERGRLRAAQERLKAAQAGIDQTTAEMDHARDQRVLLDNNARQIKGLPASMRGAIGQQIEDMKARQETLHRELNAGINAKEKAAAEIATHETAIRRLERKNRAAERAKAHPAPKSEKALRQQETSALKEEASQARDRLVGEQAKLGEEPKDARSRSQFEKRSNNPLKEFDRRVKPGLRQLAQWDAEITAQEADVKDWKQMAGEEGIPESVRQQRVSSLSAKEARLAELKANRTALATEVRTTTTEAAAEGSKGVRGAFNDVAGERIAQLERVNAQNRGTATTEGTMRQPGADTYEKANQAEIDRLKAKISQPATDHAAGRTLGWKERLQAWRDGARKGARGAAEATSVTPQPRIRVRRGERGFVDTRLLGSGRLTRADQAGEKLSRDLRAKIPAEAPGWCKRNLLGISMLLMSGKSLIQGVQAKRQLDALRAEKDAKLVEKEITEGEARVIDKAIADFRTTIDAHMDVAAAWGLTAGAELAAQSAKLTTFLSQYAGKIPARYLTYGKQAIGPVGATVAGFFEWKAATKQAAIDAGDKADIRQLNADLEALGLGPEEWARVSEEVEARLKTLIKHNEHMQKFLTVMGSASVLSGPLAIILMPAAGLFKYEISEASREQAEFQQPWQYWLRRSKTSDLAPELLNTPKDWAGTATYMQYVRGEGEVSLAGRSEEFKRAYDTKQKEYLESINRGLAHKRESILTAMLYADEQQQLGKGSLDHAQERLARIRQARSGKVPEDRLLVFDNPAQLRFFIESSRSIVMEDLVVNDFQRRHKADIVSKFTGREYTDYIIRDAGSPTGYTKAYFHREDVAKSGITHVKPAKDASGKTTWEPIEAKKT